MDPNLDRRCILRQQTADLLTSFNDLANPEEKTGAGNMIMNGMPWSKDVASALAFPPSNSKVTRQFVDQQGSFFPDQNQTFGIQKLIQSGTLMSSKVQSSVSYLCYCCLDIDCFLDLLFLFKQSDGISPQQY